MDAWRIRHEGASLRWNCVLPAVLSMGEPHVGYQRVCPSLACSPPRPPHTLTASGQRMFTILHRCTPSANAALNSLSRSAGMLEPVWISNQVAASRRFVLEVSNLLEPGEYWDDCGRIACEATALTTPVPLDHSSNHLSSIVCLRPDAAQPARELVQLVPLGAG